MRTAVNTALFVLIQIVTAVWMLKQKERKNQNFPAGVEKKLFDREVGVKLEKSKINDLVKTCFPKAK